MKEYCCYSETPSGMSRLRGRRGTREMECWAPLGPSVECRGFHLATNDLRSFSRQTLARGGVVGRSLGCCSISEMPRGISGSWRHPASLSGNHTSPGLGILCQNRMLLAILSAIDSETKVRTLSAWELEE
ncbi:hypothetical protein LIA77_11609 [Sarocladium implicatum]|nr:hypothetical protein LIA77_11609 [Sarocladium implicatum]